jgi:hypothetical protein
MRYIHVLDLRGEDENVEELAVRLPLVVGGEVRDACCGTHIYSGLSAISVLFFCRNLQRRAGSTNSRRGSLYLAWKQ